MRPLRPLSVFLAAGMLSSAQASIDDANADIVRAEAGVLSLRTGAVRVADLASLLVGDQPYSSGVWYVVMFDGPLSPARRAALLAVGVQAGPYLPSNALLCTLDRATPAALRGLKFVTWVGAYENAWKLDPELARAPADQGGAIRTWVTLFPGQELQPFRRAIRGITGAAVGVSSRFDDCWLCPVRLPRESMAVLATLGSVQFIEPATDFAPRNDNVRWIVQSNQAGVTPLYDHGLRGENQLLGMIDGPVTINHCSFSDTDPIGPLHRKIQAYNATPGYDSHGTHVCGTAVGDGGFFSNTRGVAYLARFVFNTYPQATEQSVYDRFNLHRTQGARVHNNSWGSDATNSYNGTCRAIDSLQWTYDDNLILFAVSDGNFIRNPENAKNCLAVSGSGTAGAQDARCIGGVGPTADGRRKPEIMGPGCSIRSSSGSTGCATAVNSGTSMATPTVSGAALLMRQYFAEGFYPSGAANPSDVLLPSGALLKAALVNSAVDLAGNAGFPNNAEGWGRVLADNALYFTGESRRLIAHQARNNADGALATDDSFEITLNITASSEPLKVTLAFHDAPATAGAAFAPINDLDLVVTAPDNTAYLGNSFTDGVSTPGGSPDAINNLEQVLLIVPTPGAWTIRIDANAVNTAENQGWALIITGEVEETDPCPADFDGDGFVTGLDFDAYTAAFEAGDPASDFDGDGFVTGLDFDAYVIAFEEGC